MSILRIPSQSQISQTYTQGSLHRSISQLMDIPDKKGLVDDSLWETIMGHSSGLVSWLPPVHMPLPLSTPVVPAQLCCKQPA